jgi:hypothetical protein
MSREKSWFRCQTMDFRYQAEGIGIIMGRWEDDEMEGTW